MDVGFSRAVRHVFVTLYQEGQIYRDYYLVNHCPRCGTVLSDVEISHQELQGKLWYVRYPLADGEGSVVVATTRPETMLGDTAVAVHPDDERFAALHGRSVSLPIQNRRIPVITDGRVEQEFGTGAVKVTPAHDPVDFELGKEHGLEQIIVIDGSGRMTEPPAPSSRGSTGSRRGRWSWTSSGSSGSSSRSKITPIKSGTATGARRSSSRT